MSISVKIDLMDTFEPKDLERICKDLQMITESPLGKNMYPHDAVMRIVADKKSDGLIDYAVVIHSQPPGNPGSYRIKSCSYQSTPAKPLRLNPG